MSEQERDPAGGFSQAPQPQHHRPQQAPPSASSALYSNHGPPMQYAQPHAPGRPPMEYRPGPPPPQFQQQQQQQRPHHYPGPPPQGPPYGPPHGPPHGQPYGPPPPNGAYHPRPQYARPPPPQGPGYGAPPLADRYYDPNGPPPMHPAQYMRPPMHPGQPHPGQAHPGQPQPAQPHPAHMSRPPPPANHRLSPNQALHPDRDGPRSAHSNSSLSPGVSGSRPSSVSAENLNQQRLSGNSARLSRPSSNPSIPSHAHSEAVDSGSESTDSLRLSEALSSMEISGPPPEGPKPTFRSYSVKRPNGPPPKPNAAGNQQQQSGSKVSKVSLEKTLEMYRMNALKSGDDRLRFDFAKYLLDESGKTTDNALKDKLSEEAFALLKELSKAGNPDAMFTLGQAYFEDTQYTLAHPQLLAAAKRSHPGAMYLLGVLSEKGAGTKKSTKISMDFYTKSAQAGYRPALYRLGMIEYQGLLGTKRDVRKAVMWFKRGAAVADTEHPECLYELAKIYEEGVPPHIQQDEGYALGLYKEASELEYPPAQNVLASCYEFGRLGCAKDLQAALYWYGRAAEHGHPEAQFVLAGWYLHGFPPLVPKNESEAYAWTYRAAKQNHAESQYAIGFFCEAGIGCQKSLEKAVVWYQLASGRGEKRAEERLRELREENPGMPALAPQVVKEGKGMFGFLKK